MSRAARSIVMLVSLLAVAVVTPPAQAADIVITLPTGDGFVVDNNNSIERLRIDEATGNISRNGALFVHTTGGSTTTFVGRSAGNLSMTGGRNTGVGWAALNSNTTGISNAAFGEEALRYNNTGINNAAFGENALKFNAGGNSNAAFGQDALRANDGGDRNSSFGRASMRLNTSGEFNSAFGDDALRANNGSRNSAFGQAALRNNLTGVDNSAFGLGSLYLNTMSSNNTAVGWEAQRNATGNDNTSLGWNALRNATGDRNIAIGQGAGGSLTTGHDNINIGHPGVAGDDHFIRIGVPAVHTNGTFIAGIHNILIPGPAQNVLVNSNGLLGTSAPSSLRFKEDVHDMGESSEVLRSLRPVVFRYRKELVDSDGRIEYGLIAEEVAEVFPGLVVEDAEGKPDSVRYSILTPMLLNEVQKQQRTIEEQQQRAGEQQQVIAALTGRLDAIEQQLGAASASADR